MRPLLSRSTGEGGSDAIVQVTTQSSAFFLAGEDETFAGVLQVVDKRASVSVPPRWDRGRESGELRTR